MGARGLARSAEAPAILGLSGKAPRASDGNLKSAARSEGPLDVEMKRLAGGFLSVVGEILQYQSRSQGFRQPRPDQVGQNGLIRLDGE